MVIAHCSEALTLADPAFIHAVALAERSGVAARGIHVAQGLARAALPPTAAALLERWGRAEARIDHAWSVSASAEDAGDALLDAVASVKPELLLINTHARRGLARIFAGSVAEAVARNVAVPVLLLPTPGLTLVDSQTGALRLTRVLLLAGPREDTERAVRGLASLMKLAAVSRCALELLHVDDGTPAPDVVLPSELIVSRTHTHGPIERAVIERILADPPDVLVMTSHGHDQWRDVVWSSHTERVLHESRRPLLWVPAPQHPA